MPINEHNNVLSLPTHLNGWKEKDWIPSVGEDVDQPEPPCPVGGGVSPLWNTIYQFPFILNIHIPYKPAVPPGNLPKRNKNMCSHKDL